jgi:hypothetical protein
MMNGSPNGSPHGLPKGSPNGLPQGSLNGLPQGSPTGLPPRPARGGGSPDSAAGMPVHAGRHVFQPTGMLP